MPSEDGLYSLFSKLYDNQREVEMSLEEYLRGCAENPTMMASAAARA